MRPSIVLSRSRYNPVRKKKITTALLLAFFASVCFALEPNEILIIANRDIESSMDIAAYYRSRRNVPKENVLALSLGPSLTDDISRDDYDSRLAGPIRRALLRPEFSGRIRCLLTIYGVPYKVGARPPLAGRQKRLQKLRRHLQIQQSKLEQILQNKASDSNESNDKDEMQIRLVISRLKSEIDRIMGVETNAAVDSELSMVLFGPYELYRWQPNRLKKNLRDVDTKTLMVSRLDGPSAQITRSLIDKSIVAEQTGLQGAACIDSRGIANDDGQNSFGRYDQSLRDLAVLTRFQTRILVREERTDKLFEPGSCPRTALYCGWYRLKDYVDAFDFVDGAVGYHIASLEAVDLHDANSRQWCPAMLADGITATLGAVAEPYLHSFPKPKDFFLELFDGRCLVEAYYRTKPFNSWQLVLVGDPLYTPFEKHSARN